MKNIEKKSSVSRIRWAAVGAAVAVTLGAGGLVGVQAEDIPTGNTGQTAYVPVDPIRVWDSRTDTPADDGSGTALYPGLIYQRDLSKLLYDAPADGGYGSKYLVSAVVINVTIPGGGGPGYVSVTPSICEVPTQLEPINDNCFANIYKDPATAGYDTTTLTSSVNWGGNTSIANMITVPIGEWGTEGSGSIDFLMPWILDAEEADNSVADVVVDLVGFYSTGCNFVNPDPACSGG